VRLVKLPATRLEPGMFIAELDRPWLETPFELQGFVVRDADEIQYVSNYVDHVYIDVEYSGARRSLKLATNAVEPKPIVRLALREEFKSTKIAFERAAETLASAFHALRNGSETSQLKEVQAALNPLIDSVFRCPEAVAALLRLKDGEEYHYRHGIAMAIWGVMLGRQLGLDRHELDQLALGCALCDIGMTQLPAELLDQAENLTDAQRRIIRAHPIMGADLVSRSLQADVQILEIIENHHERMDGSGYPRGKTGKDIPLLACIAGMVDTYDAMITPRPYAKARSSNEASLELLDCSGHQFQESLVEQFVQAIGLFPTGTLVELNTGEVAIVVSQNSTRRLKPAVVIVLNRSKERLIIPKVLDLAKQCIAAEGERWISRELRSGTYGVSAEEFFI
jgi:HD-GYP domain-containing protein (c-di-GMP phosphodiesterase class II)